MLDEAIVVARFTCFRRRAEDKVVLRAKGVKKVGFAFGVESRCGYRDGSADATSWLIDGRLTRCSREMKGLEKEGILKL